MKTIKEYDNLSIDDLDLAVTERHLQNETMLWVYDPANADFQNIANQFSLHVKLVPVFEFDIKKINLNHYSIILLDCFNDSDFTLRAYDEIKISNKNTVVLAVVDVNTPASTIIQLNVKNLNSYILHPIQPDSFWKTVMNELEKKRHNTMKYQMEEIHGNKLKERLEWLTYKEQMRDMGKNSEGNLMIESLRNSLTQAGGFGIIMSLIDMAKSFSERIGEDYLIKKNIMDMLIANNDYAQKFLDALNSVVGLMSQNLKLTRTSSEELISELDESMKGVREYLMEKDIILHLPGGTPQGEAKFLKLNIESIMTVIEEMIINAGKYGRNGSIVDVYASYVKGYFCISVKNELKDEKAGIPDAIIEQLLKPFYRYHPPVEDIVKVEKYGLGLGLTAVNYILNKHHGMFIFSNVKDHTGNRVVPCSLAQIYLPIETGS